MVESGESQTFSVVVLDIKRLKTTDLVDLKGEYNALLIYVITIRMDSYMPYSYTTMF